MFMIDLPINRSRVTKVQRDLLKLLWTGTWILSLTPRCWNNETQRPCCTCSPASASPRRRVDTYYKYYRYYSTAHITHTTDTTKTTASPLEPQTDGRSSVRPVHTRYITQHPHPPKNHGAVWRQDRCCPGGNSEQQAAGEAAAAACERLLGPLRGSDKAGARIIKPN